MAISSDEIFFFGLATFSSEVTTFGSELATFSSKVATFELEIASFASVLASFSSSGDKTCDKAGDKLGTSPPTLPPKKAMQPHNVTLDFVMREEMVYKKTWQLLLNGI